MSDNEMIFLEGYKNYEQIEQEVLKLQATRTDQTGEELTALNKEILGDEEKLKTLVSAVKLKYCLIINEQNKDLDSQAILMDDSRVLSPMLRIEPKSSRVVCGCPVMQG